MVIPDEEHAKRKLSQIGYYRLSGFWYPCRTVKVGRGGECITSNNKSTDNTPDNVYMLRNSTGDERRQATMLLYSLLAKGKALVLEGDNDFNIYKMGTTA